MTPARPPISALRLDHVVGTLHEGERHPVDAEVEAEGEVLAILLR